MREVINCENCKYYDEIEDADMPGYRECHYFSSWATVHYMLPDDGCTCGKGKNGEDPSHPFAESVMMGMDGGENDS